MNLRFYHESETEMMIVIIIYDEWWTESVNKSNDKMKIRLDFNF